MEGLQGGRAVGVLVGVEAGAAEDGGGEAQQPRLDEGELAQREDEEEEAAEDEGPEQVGLGGDQDPLGHVLEQQHQPRPHTLHTQIDNINMGHSATEPMFTCARSGIIVTTGTGTTLPVLLEAASSMIPIVAVC